MNRRHSKEDISKHLRRTFREPSGVHPSVTFLHQEPKSRTLFERCAHCAQRRNFTVLHPRQLSKAGCSEIILKDFLRDLFFPRMLVGSDQETF